MYYKPYFDFVYKDWTLKDIKKRLLLFKENGKDSITEKEFKEIIVETDSKLSKNIFLVKDFIRDTEREITDIKEKVMAMKK